MTTVHPARDVLPALLVFSDRFHRAVGGRHHVASPLGAWMLLAVAATAAPTGPERDALTAALGMEPEAAADYVRRLLERPHEAVASAVALWTREAAETDALRAWRAQLPNGIASGPMPNEAEAAEWLQAAMRGLITDPPRIVTRGVLTLLNVVATRAKWVKPYGLLPASTLAPTDRRDPEDRMAARALPRIDRDWADRLDACLHSNYGEGGRIVHSPLAGDVAVHSRVTEDGLEVFSVIAHPSVSPATVLTAAHQIATAIATGEEVHTRSLFDLPLGDAPCWSISERTVRAAETKENVEAVLPEWSARSTHALKELVPGFAAAGAVVNALLDLPPAEFIASQQVFARYSLRGFEAWAVSSFLSRSLTERQETPPDSVRDATLRFRHPYAAVAIAVEGPGDRVVGRDFVRSPWRGLPVFSAWISDPDGAADADPNEAEDDASDLERYLKALKLTLPPTW